MKKVLPLIAMFAASVVFTAPAQANDGIAQSLCSYVKANDKNSLRKALTDNRIRVKNIYDGLQCEGLPLVRFAIKNNANDVGEFIVKQLPGNFVAGLGDVEWAQSNGFATSALLDVIKTRSAG